MRRHEAWSTLRHLVVEGSPRQAATMLSALLLGYPDEGPDRTALLSEIAFAQVLGHERDAALASARRAMASASHDNSAGHVGPRALASATYALVATIRGPEAGQSPEAARSALEVAGELVLDLDSEDAAAPMASYLLAETALLQGRFFVAEEAAKRARVIGMGPDALDPLDPIIVVLSELVLARSVVMRGARIHGKVLATRAADRAAKLDMDSLEALGRSVEAVIGVALQDVTAAGEAERRVRRLSNPVGPSLLDTACWTLLAYAAFLNGRHAEATDLLVTAGGGPDLSRLPWSLRGPAYELLATVSVAREELHETSAWLARAGATDTPRAARHLDRSALRDFEVSAARSATPSDAQKRSHPHDEAAADDLAGGWAALTPRERHIATLAARGLTNGEVAERLFLTERVVRQHLASIYRILGVSGRARLAAVLGNLLPSSTGVDRALPPLTQRQEGVARLVADGCTNAQIAEQLSMSVKTVEKHVRDIFHRWGLRNRAALATAWRDYEPTALRSGAADA